MVVIFNNGEFGATNMFQFDREVEFWENGKKTFEITPTTVAKETKIIRDIKKIFNYNCNDFVTFVKDDEVTVLTPNNAYRCVATHEDRLRVIEKLNINIKETLNNLKNGK